ncbi:sugar ABC transporter ATP-binding protein, partial [Acinetobacter baumannii]|nr:sugar ABC transporter ATP-binding protein [Acinetobacter baumannii]
GFHPELTGRENIYLNATLLGLRRKEVQQRMERIIEFSELGEFIDEPIRVYSSGMLAKLGFSVISQVEPDILIIDEVLAVGDIAFQAKCIQT